MLQEAPLYMFSALESVSGMVSALQVPPPLETGVSYQTSIPLT